MMEIQRRTSRPVWVGKVQVGGDAPIVVQSMTNTSTADVQATVRQINELADLGCEIARVAVPDRHAAVALPDIVRHSPVPVVADIHYDYRLALILTFAVVVTYFDILRVLRGESLFR